LPPLFCRFKRERTTNFLTFIQGGKKKEGEEISFYTKDGSWEKQGGGGWCRFFPFSIRGKERRKGEEA